jgi:hypothetical protein
MLKLYYQNLYVQNSVPGSFCVNIVAKLFLKAIQRCEVRRVDFDRVNNVMTLIATGACALVYLFSSGV